MMKKQNPKLALTMGDPAGVGPEVVVGAWPFLFNDPLKRTNSQEESCGINLSSNSNKETKRDFPTCRPFVFGHPTILQKAIQLRNLPLELETISLESVAKVADHYFDRFGPTRIPCVNCCDDSVLGIHEGQIDPIAGEAAFNCLNRAIDLALDQTVDGIVTAPLHKKSLNLAGHNFPGHTEILASRCAVDDYAMLLYLGSQPNIASESGLAVVHVTLHTAMRNVFQQITQEGVLEKSHLIRDFMRKIKGEEPKIGVCALNCHNGEEGLFGDEEIKTIRPAVEQAQKEGLLIEGPFPSDTLMVDAKNGRFDGIVAMIHDQGHIAIKLLGMHKAVNITLGLPIIRTSVAHGTAFDRAWQGTAEVSSLVEAVRVAVLLNKS
ncbi:MAG: 4-hydroxythreonine-4-phosphate dehydrogenase PdxA [Planctomycetia bacterium]|nr:4-hydroxythreonine-4-phosphate dehydrogenase PdxA [Planctomycetia bacterium]